MDRSIRNDFILVNILRGRVKCRFNIKIFLSLKLNDLARKELKRKAPRH